MKIDSIDVYLIKNELFFPWTTAYGSDDYATSVLVKMRSGDKVGWSESSCFARPEYSGEYGEGMVNVISKFLVPMVVGKTFDAAEEINAAMDSIKDNQFAKAAIEIAWWTLQVKVTGVPFYKLIGGSNHEITVGQALGIQPNFDVLIEKVGKRIDEGSPRVKLKMCHGWDYDMLEAVRSAYPNHPLHVDCNSSYSLDEIDLFKRIDKFHLEMIEQPFNYRDFVDHAKLAATIETPICLDESITSVHAAKQAIALKSCKYINIKPGRVGGIYNSIKINQLCMEAGVGCWIGGMLENDVGRGILVELCSMPNIVYPSDVNPGYEKIKYNFTKQRVEYTTPYHFYPKERPEDLIEPDERLLEKIIVDRRHFE